MFIGEIHAEIDHRKNLYCDGKNNNFFKIAKDIEIDYKGDDLTFESILNIIRGRYANYVTNYQ